MSEIPRILDPRRVPVAGVDSHLPAVDADRLTPHALRERFASGEPYEPEHAGDGRPFAGRVPTPAAVLLPLVQRPEGLTVLLTRRAEHLRNHAGQISFPGGRCEPGDVGPAGTALREAHEEVGLPPALASVIGALPAYTTVTHYVVTPVVALVPPRLQLVLDPLEVAEAFEVPLVWLMNPAHHCRHRVEFDSGPRQFLSMSWQSGGDVGESREYFIWGATAAMLRNLYRFLVR
jgi:8-oxo-dGTP pyrophosphatase MutT (NUDIX family)